MSDDFQAFNESFRFFKGNLHCHTTASDGAYTPEETVLRYKEKNYSFIAITDHNVYHDYRRELDSSSFITIPGFELSVLWFMEKGKPDLEKAHHLLALLKTEDTSFKENIKIDFPKVYGKSQNFHEITQAAINMLKENGFSVAYNHPVWSRVLDNDFIDLENLDFLEIYNHGSEVFSNAGYDNASWQKMLDNNIRINAIATDDNHNHNDEISDSFGGYVMVNTDKLTHESIMKALLEGKYFSSTGAHIINWGIKSRKAYISCSPARKIILRYGNGINDGIAEFGNHLEYAEFPVPENASYIRFEITDDNGKMAWTNALWIHKRILS